MEVLLKGINHWWEQKLQCASRWIMFICMVIHLSEIGNTFWNKWLTNAYLLVDTGGWFWGPFLRWPLEAASSSISSITFVGDLGGGVEGLLVKILGVGSDGRGTVVKNLNSGLSVPEKKKKVGEKRWRGKGGKNWVGVEGPEPQCPAPPLCYNKIWLK